MSSAEIVSRAPGKLFIAGEYAVVTAGEPSVLIAVDRYLEARLTESADEGSIHSPEYGGLPLRWTTGPDGVAVDRERHPYDYVLATIRLSERLRVERGIPPRLFDLRLDSGLDDAGGRKFGLGSSAAVTVATARAIDRFHGFGLSEHELFRLALLATVQVAPAASGGDVAASVFGGWVGYSAPDRDRLRRALATEPIESLVAGDDPATWEGLRIQRLRPPRDLSLLVGWTGEPASTTRLVGDLARRARSGAVDHPAFVADSRECVEALWTALTSGDDVATLACVQRARRLLQRLGRDAGLDIETPQLTTLCDAAEATGSAGKVSGAGGGDCGIVLAPRHADVAAMLRAWEAHDIRHLSISVHPPQGAVHVG